MAALLELENVQAAYGSVKALHGVTLRVDEGQIVSLLGANGAGKTTTLRAVSGTVKRTGSIRFAGRDISRASPEDVARLKIAHVPEGRGTLAQLSVWDNLRMGAYVRRDGARIKEDYERVFQYFPWMKERRDQVSVTLSGGEQQMLAIGRALMLRPRLLLMDEPSLGLAPLVTQEIYRIVRAINEEDKVTILVVEQNARIALRAANYAYVIETGSIAIDGSAQELANDESIRRSYLGY
ncbi:MAG: ABC transporter ATP-binding protein [Chloroflexota bacterium]